MVAVATPALQGTLGVEPMEVRVLEREFRFGGRLLADPGAHMEADEVRRFYSRQPGLKMLTTAAIKGPEVVGDRLVFTFEQSVGAKG
jgi:PRTRC genetic system protein C